MAVVDTGTGMSKDQISKSTNMLGVLIRTADVNSNGIGLGLTISSELVKVHNGSLQVNSYGENLGSIV